MKLKKRFRNSMDRGSNKLFLVKYIVLFVICQATMTIRKPIS